MDDFKSRKKNHHSQQSKPPSKRETSKKRETSGKSGKNILPTKIENIKSQETENIMKLNLQYFSNLNGLPSHIQQQYKVSNTNSSNKYSKQDIGMCKISPHYTQQDYSIYRKDAFEITKNMFYSKKKQEYNEDIIESFDIFMGKVIEFLKTKEYSEYFQEDYTGIDNNSSQEEIQDKNETSLEKHHNYFVEQELKQNNMLMMKHLNPETQSLDKMIHIKKTKLFKPKSKHGFPQKREPPKREKPRKHKRKDNGNNTEKQNLNENKNL